MPPLVSWRNVKQTQIFLKIYSMSFTSCKNQTNLNQTFYNPVVVGNSSISSNLYVAETLTFDLAPITAQIAVLQGQVQALQTKVAFLQQKIQPIIGEIIGLPTSIAPPNYLPCDGSDYLITQYIDLFNVIGTVYGSVGGLYFNTPNLQSKFLLGAGVNISGIAYSDLPTNGNSAITSYDSSVTIDMAAPHIHTLKDPGHTHKFAYDLECAFVDESQLLKTSTSGVATNPSFFSTTGITELLPVGSGQQPIDFISNLAGVNITPPYIALNFFICYQ